MSTLVYQSYRTTAVPGWIARSMDTVRAWAATRGFAYARFDDAFFDVVPTWYRDRVGAEPVRMSDLARLLHAERLLAQHDRVVWVDADVVVFDPDRFTVDAPLGYALCRESWISLAPDGRVQHSARVNNAVAVFARQNPFLAFYLHACTAIVQHTEGPVDMLAVGTRFLTLLHRAMPLPLLGSVAALSALVLRDLAAGGGEMTRLAMDRQGGPVRAANLCGSLRARVIDGVVVDDALYDAVVTRLLATQGEVMNQFAPGGLR